MYVHVELKKGVVTARGDLNGTKAEVASLICCMDKLKQTMLANLPSIEIETED